MKKQLVTLLILYLSLPMFAQTGGQSIQIGDLQDELIYFVESDSQNNIVVVGSFEGTADFDPSPATAEFTSFNLTADIFVAKYNQDLELLWVLAILIEDDFTVNDVVVDASDNIYVLGEAEGTLTCAPGLGNQVIGADPSAFIAKYNSTGSYQWVNGIGDGSLSASSGAFFQNMVIEANGTLRLIGRIEGEVDVDPDFFDSQLVDGGNGYLIITNYNANGDMLSFGASDMGLPHKMIAKANGDYYNAGIGFFGAYLYTMSLDGTVVNGGSLGGGTGSGNLIIDLDTDADGNVYLYFQFDGQLDFDLGAGEHLLQSSGTDVYLAKYTPTLELLWANQFSGTSLTTGTDMEIGSDGVYITGHFLSEMDADPGLLEELISSVDGQDGFVIKMDENGIFEWTHVISGQYGDIPMGLAVANNEQVTVGGFFAADLLPYAGATLNSNGATDGFLFTLNQPTMVSIDDMNESGIRYFPNPTKSNLQITSLDKIDTVNLYDLSGKRLKSISVNRNSLTLDLNNLAPGNYLVEIQSQDKVKTVQVIKQ